MHKDSENYSPHKIIMTDCVSSSIVLAIHSLQISDNQIPSTHNKSAM